jgi:aryl-alcohol dehydrogenase-like predicted oxidoreductase
MQLRQIGDTKVSALGLGGMPMSIEGRPEESRSIATIHAALGGWCFSGVAVRRVE